MDRVEQFHLDHDYFWQFIWKRYQDPKLRSASHEIQDHLGAKIGLLILLIYNKHHDYFLSPQQIQTLHDHASEFSHDYFLPLHEVRSRLKNSAEFSIKMREELVDDLLQMELKIIRVGLESIVELWASMKYKKEGACPLKIYLSLLEKDNEAYDWQHAYDEILKSHSYEEVEQEVVEELKSAQK